MRRLTVALSISVIAATAGAAHAEVNVDIHIGRPAPPPVVIAPAPAVVVVPPPVIAARPRVVVVPGTRVYHVPSVGFNVFVFGGKYYSHHHDRWFVATGHNAHWVAISENRVPPPVLAVPVSYYKIPPGHAKKWRDDDRHGHGRRHPGRRGWDD